MIGHIKNSLQTAQVALGKLISDEATLSDIELAAQILLDTFDKGYRVFSCGNGGSMCDAMHFAEELTGRYRKDRRAYPAVAISDPSHLTCVANDYGFNDVFSRYIEGHGNAGDCLIAISTSGNSINIINAAKTANSSGIRVIGLTGNPDTQLEHLSEVCICTPAGQFADRIQELHIKVLHILIEMVERHFHSENY